MRVPNKLPENSEITGTQLKRSFNQLIDVVKSSILRSSPTIKVSSTPSGTTARTVKPLGKGGGGGGGTTIYWAKVTAVTDANNYTVSIYDRSDESTAIETSKQMRVFDIVDQLAVNDWVPVQSSNVTNEDYEAIQQLGAVG